LGVEPERATGIRVDRYLDVLDSHFSARCGSHV
jgi:hypothetical protein